MSRILIVDDEQAIGWSLRELLGDDGHEVELAASVEAAVEACGRFRPEAILLDVRLGSRDGLAALPDLREIVADAPVIVMTAFGDLDTAVRAVQAGACEYLLKPFDLERVSAVVARALADRAGSPATMAAAQPASAGGIVGATPLMQEVFKQIALVAATDLPVLVSGETGTGKELVARAIHAHGRRRQGPFVAVNLAALAPGAVDESLFGQHGGGRAGAAADRPGLFALAEGGTIFLDEIGEASADVQVKLLRVLETHEVTPVGSAGSRRVDVRVMAATNRELDADVADGKFRSDLYHRLHAFPLRLPPLVDRTADIAALARHFLALHAARQGDSAPPPTLTPEFIAALERRAWPGNVRELKHAVEYAAVMARGGMLRPEHMPAGPSAAAVTSGPHSALDAADEAVTAAVRDWSAAARLAWGDLPEPDLHRRAVELLEATLLREALAHSGGNRTAAAKLLGLDRATLRTKLRHLGIDD